MRTGSSAPLPFFHSGRRGRRGIRGRSRGRRRRLGRSRRSNIPGGDARFPVINRCGSGRSRSPGSTPHSIPGRPGNRSGFVTQGSGTVGRSGFQSELIDHDAHGQKGRHKSHPDAPVEASGRVDTHRFAALGVESSVERLVGGEVLEFQYADTLHHQPLAGPDAGEPAHVDIFGRRAVAPCGTGNGVDERLAAALRREVHQPHGRLHLPARKTSGRLALHTECPHIGEPDYVVCRKQIAD